MVLNRDDFEFFGHIQQLINLIYDINKSKQAIFEEKNEEINPTNELR